MTSIDWEEVVQDLSAQVGSLAKQIALLKSLANRQDAEIQRLKAELASATQESEKTT